MTAKAMCGKHDVRLMLRQVKHTGDSTLACPYCDMEELGGGESERRLIDEALGRNSSRPN
jgi:hypothetical protein